MRSAIENGVIGTMPNAECEGCNADDGGIDMRAVFLVDREEAALVCSRCYLTLFNLGYVDTEREKKEMFDV